MSEHCPLTGHLLSISSSVSVVSDSVRLVQVRVFCRALFGSFRVKLSSCQGKLGFCRVGFGSVLVKFGFLSCQTRFLSRRVRLGLCQVRFFCRVKLGWSCQTRVRAKFGFSVVSRSVSVASCSFSSLTGYLDKMLDKLHPFHHVRFVSSSVFLSCQTRVRAKFGFSVVSSSVSVASCSVSSLTGYLDKMLDKLHPFHHVGLVADFRHHPEHFFIYNLEPSKQSKVVKAQTDQTNQR